MSSSPHGNWDAPADGDFAIYVERLSAAQAQHPAPLAHLDGALQKAAASTVPASESAPMSMPTTRPEAASSLSVSGVVGVVRVVRAVVLLLVIGQALALFYFKAGVLPLLLFTGVLWFFLGRLQRFLPRAITGSTGVDGASLQRLRKQLQRSVSERTNTRKK